MPVQVKGKNDESLLNRQMITYPVEYRHLRNYYKDGGVCYFVIIVSDNSQRGTIFYNALTPVKLQSYLEGKEDKRAEQTKNIPLKRLNGNDKNKLFNLLWQFGYERGGQGAKEIVRKAISYEDLDMRLGKKEKDAINAFEQLEMAVNEYKIEIDKRWDELAEIDFKALDELVKLNKRG